MVGNWSDEEEAIVSSIIQSNPVRPQLLASPVWMFRPEHTYQCPETSGSQAVEVYMRYMVVIEEGPTSFGAYVPDLPGCVAVGETPKEALQLILEAIEFHIEGLKEEGQSIPMPHSSSSFVEVHA